MKHEKRPAPDGVNARREASSEPVYSRVFGMPPQLSSKAPFLELNSNRELYLGGYRSLVRYDEDTIVMRLCDGTYLRVEGDVLSLCAVSDNIIEVRGTIRCIGFSETLCAEDEEA